MPAEMLAETSMVFSTMLSPWHSIVDPVKFDRWVDRVAELRPTAMVGAHGPMICGARVEEAIERVRQVPYAAECVLPGQPMLDEILGALIAAA